MGEDDVNVHRIRGTHDALIVGDAPTMGNVVTVALTSPNA